MHAAHLRMHYKDVPQQREGDDEKLEEMKEEEEDDGLHKGQRVVGRGGFEVLHL